MTEHALDSYAERVLGVLVVHEWTPQALVLKLARMDTTRCVYALRQLRARGYIEAAMVKRGIGNGSGRPGYIYRRVAS
jgi:RIO-like serine/threonine protein kinase